MNRVRSRDEGLITPPNPSVVERQNGRPVAETDETKVVS
jgi:hypothetical protein